MTMRNLRDELHDSIEKMSSKKNSLLFLIISARKLNLNKQYSEKLLNLQKIKKHLRISFMMYEKKSQLLNFGGKKYKTNLYIFEKEPMDMT